MSQRLGQRHTAAYDHHIDIGRGTTEVVVADIAAHHIGIDPLLMSQAGDLTEYGV